MATMTRRRLLLFGVPAVAVVLAVGVSLLWPRTAITRDNFDRIQLGMALADVEAILGGPPGYYTSPSVGHWENLQVHTDTRFIPGKLWVGDEAVITVALDGTGIVTDKEIRERVPLRLQDKIRRWLQARRIGGTS